MLGEEQRIIKKYVGKGFLNPPYKRDKSRLGRAVRCHSNIVVYS